MTDEQKLLIVKGGLEFVYVAIQDALDGDLEALPTALQVLDLMKQEKEG